MMCVTTPKPISWWRCSNRHARVRRAPAFRGHAVSSEESSSPFLGYLFIWKPPIFFQICTAGVRFSNGPGVRKSDAELSFPADSTRFHPVFPSTAGFKPLAQSMLGSCVDPCVNSVCGNAHAYGPEWRIGRCPREARHAGRCGGVTRHTPSPALGCQCSSKTNSGRNTRMRGCGSITRSSHHRTARLDEGLGPRRRRSRTDT